MWNLYFKEVCNRYNSPDMDEDGKMMQKNFAGVEFQIFPTDYHTWGCPVFVLEYPLYGGPAGIPKWEPRERIRFYLGN